MFSKALIIKPDYTACPASFAYVLGTFDKHGLSFDFVDVTYTTNYMSLIRKLIKKNSYYAVMTGGLLGFYEEFRTLRSYVKSLQDVPFLLGGSIVRDAWDGLLFDYIQADYCLNGEIETSLLPLYDFLHNRSLPKNVPGLVYKNGESIVRNEVVRLNLLENDSLPAWNYFNKQYFIQSVPFIGSGIKMYPIFSGRGCVGKCHFCAPSVGGFRKRNVEDILLEMKNAVEAYHFECFFFYNEMFYPTKREIVAFCEKYINSGIQKPWHAQIRIDAKLDVETMEMMKKAGCLTISAGIESGSDAILRRMNKHSSNEAIRSFCQNARKTGLPYNGTFIVGYPTETEKDIQATIDLAIEEKINTDASLLRIYSGTEDYKIAKKQGKITDDLAHIQTIYAHSVHYYSPLSNFESFLNLTNIESNTELFHIIRKHLCRYYTFMYFEYILNDMSFQISKDILKFSNSIELNGACIQCKTLCSHQYIAKQALEHRSVLGMGNAESLICPHCFSRITFDFYSSSVEAKKHYILLKSSLQNKKILIIGDNDDLIFLIKFNIFDIDYTNIIGVIKTSNTNYTHDTFLDFHIFNTCLDVKEHFDVVLILDIQTKIDLQASYFSHKEIFYTLPENLLHSLQTSASIYFAVKPLAFFYSMARKIFKMLPRHWKIIIKKLLRRA